MQEVSGFGLEVRVFASKTFPQGFTVTEFADDIDPFDIPELQINDVAMGLNGDMVTWTFHSPLSFSMGVIPSHDNRVFGLSKSAMLLHLYLAHLLEAEAVRLRLVATSRSDRVTRQAGEHHTLRERDGRAIRIATDYRDDVTGWALTTSSSVGFEQDSQVLIRLGLGNHTHGERER